MIPFNKPYLSGHELQYIYQAVSFGNISGNGMFTKKCHKYFEERFGFKKCLLTTSGTDALEMAAMLANITIGDEVIVPSYTFVSSALAFVRQGASIIFADSGIDNPNMDTGTIESLITDRTRAIVPVHYAGIACDMDVIMNLANKYDLLVIEDAAQSIDSYYKGHPLGSIGHFAAFSFHETKNIISGEGGMLCINDSRFSERAEVIWEKGTNRASFFRGEVNKYGWVDIGSSFLPSEIIAAFLYAQLENLEVIQSRRKAIWNQYHNALKPIADAGCFTLPYIPEYATNNGHIFYLACNSLAERTALIARLKENDVLAVFHYLSLHKSDYYHDKYVGGTLTQCDRYSDCLVRLPMYYELSEKEIDKIIMVVETFYKNSPAKQFDSMKETKEK